LKLGEVYRKLVEDDFKVLLFFVRSLKQYEYVPLEYVVKKFNKWPQKDVVARVRKLSKLELLERHPTLDSYRLTFLGLNCAALHRLVKANILSAIGDIIGEGKESEIYRALDANNNLVAVKFFRIGRRSFVHASRLRDYGASFEKSTWLVRSIISGAREREALKILNSSGVTGIPRLIGGALNAVVIEYIEGIELYKVRELEDPESVLNQIIATIKDAYSKAKIVHGDLSEFNIMVAYTDGAERPIIIDWPQYLPSVHPNALNTLKKDLANIARFFKKRFRLDLDVDRVLKEIVSENTQQ